MPGCSGPLNIPTARAFTLSTGFYVCGTLCSTYAHYHQDGSLIEAFFYDARLPINAGKVLKYGLRQQ